MARKSRKTIIAEPEAETTVSCRAAIYVRLSVEDKQTNTASIETQQLIIARFLEEHPDIGVFIPISTTERPARTFTDPDSSRCSPT